MRFNRFDRRGSPNADEPFRLLFLPPPPLHDAFSAAGIGRQVVRRTFGLFFILLTAASICVLPATAHADTVDPDGFTVTGGVAGTDYDYTDDVLTVKSNRPLTIANTAPSTPTSHTIMVSPPTDSTASIILAGVNVDVSGKAGTCALVSKYGLTVTLADGSANFLKSGYLRAGLENSDYRLNIEGGPANTGSLEAVGGYNGAGVGGNIGGGGSHITISGGIVTAVGGELGAGIGGGSSAGTDITVSGGVVTAVGGDGGAGIGGGGTKGEKITISGGIVSAKGGDDAAGIGGGEGDGVDITVSGGVVTAEGGARGAGIGGGNSANGRNIALLGGTVKATGGGRGSGGLGASGIGGGGNRPGQANGEGIGNRIEGDAWVEASSIPNGMTYTKGVVFVGAEGTVYGDTPVELGFSAEIPAGKSLTIPLGKGIAVGNGAVLSNEGTLALDGGSLERLVPGAGSLEGSHGVFLKYDVKPAMITVPADLPYNGSDQAATALDGMDLIDLAEPVTESIMGKDFTVTYGDRSFWEFSVASGVEVKEVSDQYEVTCTHKGDPARKASRKFAVTPRPVTVAGTTAQDKVYDGTDAASVVLGAVSGIVGGEDVAVKPSATFADAGAGTNKIVDVGYTLDGAGAGNYTAPASERLSADIAPRQIAPLTAAVLDKDYDGTVAATVSSVTFGNAVAGNDPAYTSVGTFADANAGTDKPVDVAVTLVGDAAVNYAFDGEGSTVAHVQARASIGKASQNDVALTDRPAANRVEDRAVALPSQLPDGARFGRPQVSGAAALVSNPQVTADGMLEYRATSQPAGTAATVAIPVTGAVNHADFYVVVTAIASERDDAGVTVDGVPASLVYGDAPFALAAAAADPGTGPGVWTWTSSDPDVLKVSGDGARASVAVLKASTAPVTLTVDYLSGTTAATTSVTLSVAHARLTVTADDKSARLGDALPTFTCTVEGLVNGDAMTDDPVASTAGTTAAAGSYDIVASGGAADPDKYEAPFTYVKGVFAVEAKDIAEATVEPPAPAVYDGTAQTPKPVVADGETVLIEGVDYALSYADNRDAGQAAVTVAALGPNYVGSTSTTFAIGRAPLTIVADAKRKVAGEPDPLLTAVVKGAVADEAIDYRLRRAPGEGAGTYAIEVLVGEGAANANYDIDTVGAALVIDAAPNPAPKPPLGGGTVGGSGGGAVGGGDEAGGGDAARGDAARNVATGGAAPGAKVLAVTGDVDLAALVAVACACALATLAAACRLRRL